MISKRLKTLHNQISKTQIEFDRISAVNNKKNNILFIILIINIIFSFSMRVFFSNNQNEIFHFFLFSIFFSTFINSIILSLPLFYAKNYLSPNKDLFRRSLFCLGCFSIIMFLSTMLLNLPNDNDSIKLFFINFISSSSIIAFFSIIAYDSNKKTYFKSTSFQLRKMKGEYNYYIDKVIIEDELRENALTAKGMPDKVKEDINTKYAVFFSSKFNIKL